MLKDPHDKLFKATFSRVGLAAEELKTALPAKLVQSVEWESLRVVRSSLFGPELAQMHSDILYTARIAGRTGYIFVLFEHQSTPDPLLVARILTYMGLVLQNHVLNQKPRPSRIPAIVPLVLFHGEGGWSAPRSFHEIIDLDPETLAELAPYLPSFELLIDDLGRHTEQELLARRMSAPALLTLLLFQRMRRTEDPREDLRRWHELIKGILGDPQGLWALALALSYTMEVTDVAPEPFRHFLRTEFGPRAEEAFMTGAEQLTKEVREQALAQGIRQGEARGRAEKAAELVFKLLTRRFGQPSADVVVRVKAASIEELDRWAERVIDAKSLKDVFEGE